MSNLIIEKNSVFGDSITIQASKLDECIRYINDNNIESVYIWDWKYDSGDLSFLKECQSITQVNINSRFVQDLTALKYVERLEELTLETFSCIDVGFLQDLKLLSGNYSKIKGISDLKKLNTLYLGEYSADNKFKDIRCLPELKYLDLTEPSILDLDGIEEVEKLEHLEIVYAKKLEDISFIEALSNSLIELRIDYCKRIKDFSKIGELSLLKELALCHDGQIDSISFIKNLQNLKSFIFMDTNVLDGNISYCEKLEHVMFTNKKHFSHKTFDFKQNNRCE